jgi:hypothetical protein
LVSQWAIVYSGQAFLTITEVAHTFPESRLCVNFDKKSSWITIWAIF